MAEGGSDELDRAFVAGSLTRRAYVRGLVDAGMEMADALARAATLVPPTPAPVVHAPEGTALPARPARVEGLDINVVDDQYLVYHPARDKVHSLNTSASVILELCTGAHDQDGIARLVQEMFQLDQPPTAETEQCLRLLYDEGLVR